MNIQDLIKKINSYPSDNKIYLLESLSVTSGFFVYNEIPMFLVCDISGLNKNTSIKTNFIEMETYVGIKSIENTNSFDSGYYNILRFVGNFESNEFFSFVELCTIYSKNIKEISFINFFHAMLELFQLPTEQNFKDVLGLYGELKFLEYMKNNFGKDFTQFWHLSGNYSKFDISTNLCNFEIKTSILDNIVTIKHNQLFNDHNNYLVTIICEKYDSGETLSELLEKNSEIFTSLSFVLKLKKELLKIRPTDIKTMRFFVNEIHFYKGDIINPFVTIKTCIKDLSYKYDLSNQQELTIDEIKTLVDDI